MVKAAVQCQLDGAGRFRRPLERSGSMTQADSDALSSLLASMESRVEDDRICVPLSVPGSVVQ